MSTQAGLYLRISEDRTGEGLAVERQRDDCRQLVRLRGWTITEEFVDNDISGAGRKRRPAFEALLKAVAEGTVTVIVAWALDRLGRNRTDHHRLVEICRKHHVSLALVRGSDVDLSSAIGRGVADMMATFARIENEQRAERQRRQILQAAQKGLLGGGAPRAFGYKRGGMELDPKEAPVLAGAYERWLAGAGLEEVTDWLNRQGLPTTRGNKWRSNTLSVTLRNPRNAGLRAMRPVIDEDTGRRSLWHDPPIGKAAWPAIVSEEVWQATIARLRDPNRPGVKYGRLRKGPGHRYLLSGIAKCGLTGCGLSMITTSSGGHRRYHCRSKRHMNRRADYVEAFVIQTLIERLTQDDAHELLLPRDDVTDLDAVRTERMAKRQKLRGLAADYADGILDRDQVKVAGDELRAQVAELDEILAKAGTYDVVAPLVDAENPAKVWESYALYTQRLVVARLMDITIHRCAPGRPPGGVYDTSTIDIQWREQR